MMSRAAVPVEVFQDAAPGQRRDIHAQLGRHLPEVTDIVVGGQDFGRNDPPGGDLGRVLPQGHVGQVEQPAKPQMPRDHPTGVGAGLRWLPGSPAASDAGRIPAQEENRSVLRGRQCSFPAPPAANRPPPASPGSRRWSPATVATAAAGPRPAPRSTPRWQPGSARSAEASTPPAAAGPFADAGPERIPGARADAGDRPGIHGVIREKNRRCGPVAPAGRPCAGYRDRLEPADRLESAGRRSGSPAGRRLGIFWTRRATPLPDGDRGPSRTRRGDPRSHAGSDWRECP